MNPLCDMYLFMNQHFDIYLLIICTSITPKITHQLCTCAGVVMETVAVRPHHKDWGRQRAAVHVVPGVLSSVQMNGTHPEVHVLQGGQLSIFSLGHNISIFLPQHLLLLSFTNHSKGNLYVSLQR